MAHCTSCSKDVGCGCNLTSGLCPTCYSKTLDYTVGDESTIQVQGKRTKRIIYSKPANNNPPNTEFEIILKTQGLTKEEKIKRINDILEKARQQII